MEFFNKKLNDWYYSPTGNSQMLKFVKEVKARFESLGFSVIAGRRMEDNTVFGVFEIEVTDNRGKHGSDTFGFTEVVERVYEMGIPKAVDTVVGGFHDVQRTPQEIITC